MSHGYTLGGTPEMYATARLFCIEMPPPTREEMPQRRPDVLGPIVGVWTASVDDGGAAISFNDEHYYSVGMEEWLWYKPNSPDLNGMPRYVRLGGKGNVTHWLLEEDARRHVAEWSAKRAAELSRKANYVNQIGFDAGRG